MRGSDVRSSDEVFSTPRDFVFPARVSWRERACFLGGPSLQWLSNAGAFVGGAALAALSILLGLSILRSRNEPRASGGHRAGGGWAGLRSGFRLSAHVPQGALRPRG